MLNMLCQMAQPAAEQASGWFSFLQNMDGGAIGGGSAAAVLAGVWLFIRTIRKIVGFLFMLCVVYLVAKVCFDIDLWPAMQYLYHLFR